MSNLKMDDEQNEHMNAPRYGWRLIFIYYRHGGRDSRDRGVWRSLDQEEKVVD